MSTRRLLICSAILAVLAASRPAATGQTPAVLQRFLAIDGPAPTSYRALRHLEAHNDHFDSGASMEVWTDADRVTGFHFTVVSDTGSDYIRSHVFVPALEAERRMWEAGDVDRGAFTEANYDFEDRGEKCDGLTSLSIKPKRKDLLLVEGTIFLRPEDGELMRIEGRLTKTPSFWARRVEIVRKFQRIGGVRMPVSVESVANILIAGKSTFHMTYEYESINGQRVGTPKL